MQKILIISEKLSGQGGTEVVLKRFYENLSSQYQISFLLFNSYQAENIAPQEDRSQFWFNRGNMIEKINYKTLIKKAINKRIQHFKPQIVLCTSIDLLGHINMQENCLIYYWPHLTNKDLNFKRQKNLKNAHHVLAISTEIASQIQKYNYPLEKISVIFNPVKRQPRVIPYSTEIAQFVYIGRLHFNGSKNLQLLLDSCALLEIPYHLTIIGEGDDRNQLIEYSKKLNIISNVQFSETWIPCPWSTISQATAFVLTSRIEPFGLVLAEALSYGVPCVSTATAGPNDLIHFQKNGILSESYQPTDFAACLTKIYDDRQNYSAVNIQASIEHLYEDIFFTNLTKLFNVHSQLIDK